MSHPDIAYKILDAVDWDLTRATGSYGGSAVDLADGYIHLSTAEQLRETARRHYAGRDGLVILDVALAPLGATVKWEPSRGGDLFPHIYGPLPASAVRAARRAYVEADGRLVMGEPEVSA